MESIKIFGERLLSFGKYDTITKNKEGEKLCNRYVNYSV